MYGKTTCVVSNIDWLIPEDDDMEKLIHYFASICTCIQQFNREINKFLREMYDSDDLKKKLFEILK